MKLSKTIKLFLIVSMFSISQINAMEGDAKAEAAQHNRNGIKSLKDGPALYNQALTYFAQAVALDPANPTYHFNFAQVCFQLKKYREAIQSFTQALEKDELRSTDNLNDKQQLDCYRLRGVSYFRLNSFDKAIKYFLKTVELDENNLIHYDNLGHTYFSKKNFLEAVKAFTQAIKLNSKNIESLNRRALSNFQLKEYEKALPDFIQVAKMNPTNIFSHRNCGNTYVNLKIKNYKKALIHFLYIRATLYFEIPEYKKSLSDLNKLINLDKEFLYTYYLRGTIYSAQKKHKKAYLDISKATNTGSDLHYPEADKKCTAFRSKFIDFNKKWRSEFKEKVEKLSDNLLDRAKAYCEIENYEDALSDLKKFITDNKKSTEAYSLCAKIYFELKNYGEALFNINKVIEIDIDYKGAMDQLEAIDSEYSKYNKKIKESKKNIDFYSARINGCEKMMEQTKK